MLNAVLRPVVLKRSIIDWPSRRQVIGSEDVVEERMEACTLSCVEAERSLNLPALWRRAGKSGSKRACVARRVATRSVDAVVASMVAP